MKLETSVHLSVVGKGTYALRPPSWKTRRETNYLMRLIVIEDTICLIT